MALTGTKALTLWCKQITNGYKDVNITNMTTSWRDGLAFCAILHHYRPDLINFDKLSKENIAENNYLAFTVAENELGIPALLDVEDMVELTVPDKLSILTYVSQYYNYFKDKVPGEIPPPSRHASKRQSPYTADDMPKKKIASVPGVSAAKEVIGSTPDPNIGKGTVDRFCANCGKTVYLMERMQVEGKLFHRVCFTCSLCEMQLRMGTYRYIPAEERFYCDKHYRQRTTSTSSDEAARSRNGNNKNEQDALKNLLESLENKRKQVKEKEDDGSVMKHDSVHKRIANARKKFEDPEKMEIETEIKSDPKPHDNVNADGKELTIGSPRHRPPRPTQPPGRSPDHDLGKKEPKDSNQHLEADDIQASNSKIVPQRPNLPPSVVLHDEGKSKEPPARPSDPPGQNLPPARPTDPPAQNSKQIEHKHEQHAQHIQSKDQARFVLNDVFKKIDNQSKSTEDKGGVHIYETPFAPSSKDGIENSANEGSMFENPRYRESIKMETKPIYENTGPSLLTIGDRRMISVQKDDEIDSQRSSGSDFDSEIRGTSHSSASGHGEVKKKRLVLKVKKRKTDVGNQRISTDLENQETDSKSATLQEKRNDAEKAEGGNALMSKSNDVVMHDVREEKKTGKIEDIGDVREKTESQENVDNSKENDRKIMEVEKLMKRGEGKSSKMEEKTEEKIEEKIEDEIKEGMHSEESVEDIVQNEDHDIDNEKPESNNLGLKVDLKTSLENEENETLEKESEKESEKELDDKIEAVNKNVDNIVAKDFEKTDDVEDKQHNDTVGDREDDRENDSEDVYSDKEPYQSHPEGQKTRKVLKYVNPFEDSDDELLSYKEDDDKKSKKVVLNPFEVDTEDENEFPDESVEKQSNESLAKEDDVIGRAVSRKIKLVPGEGPKTDVSPEKVTEHQRKIESLKRRLKKEKLIYKNPFEESDDEILETDEKKIDQPGESKEKQHKKVLVLKVKKKRAPPPPTEPNKSEPETAPITKLTNENLNEEVDDEGKNVRPSLAPPDPLETFKTFVENSEIEMRKRLDSKNMKNFTQEQASFDRAGSPISASCPALDKSGFLHQSEIESRPDKASSTHNIHVNESKTVDGVSKESLMENENMENQMVGNLNVSLETQGKKEKPPKRPAPPVPKGIMPFKEPPVVPHQSAVAPGSSNILDEPEPVGKSGLDEAAKNVEKPENKKALKGKELKEKGKKKEKHERKGKEKGKHEEKNKEKEKKKKKEKRGMAKEDEQGDTREKVTVEENHVTDEWEDQPMERTYSFVEEKELTIEDIGKELKEIEAEQRILEGKGVKMEKRLREQLHGEPEEDYMITWFDLVTEKNKLLRRENELIYMSQEIEYHNYQKKIEFELRLLMEKDESSKTDEDRHAEEQLLDQLVNYVSRRNRIVEKIEQDRLREKEEDDQIQMIMQAQGLRKQKKKKGAKKSSTGAKFYA